MSAEQTHTALKLAWRAREAERLERLRRLGEEARAEAVRLAKLLRREFGATRVVLFGSLARGNPTHENFDIDLAVEGIATGRRFEAGGTLRLEASRAVELVDLDDVGEPMRTMILKQGVVLT